MKSKNPAVNMPTTNHPMAVILLSTLFLIRPGSGLIENSPGLLYLQVIF